MSIVEFKIELGAEVKDKVSGYKGLVVGRHHYLYGCHRYSVHSQELKDGKPVDGFTFDEGQLEVIKKTTKVSPENQGTGGPGDGPPRRQGPARRSEPTRRSDPSRR
jgi:hypothetical protein